MTSEKRSDYRLTGKVRVCLELDSGDPEAGNQVRVLETFTTDLSIAGLRVQCRQQLQEGALLSAVVSLESRDDAFSLMTEVIWCRPLGNDRWAAGLRILESDGTSYLEWVETIAAAMGQD
ncbi:MAG: PilZ domain-containing protein [Marinobacter sp.]|nr:PilZ domain-containing protein [Marinobacter sp.]